MSDAAPVNRLLEGLPREERQNLLKHVEPVSMRVGAVLCEPGQPLPYVYFPVTGFIALLMPVPESPALEMGLIGNEGMLGAPLALGVKVSHMRAVVQGAGAALRIATEQFELDLRGNPEMRRMLNRYLFVVMNQRAQSAACFRFHNVNARLARWLLLTHDRAHHDHLHLTHKDLADMLGVQRRAITIAAGNLQQQALIRYVRGIITILDRKGLEAASCECYRLGSEYYMREFDPLIIPSQEVLSSMTSARDNRVSAVNGDTGVRKYPKQDLIERKIMEHSLLVERDQAEATLNSMGDAVACTDRSGNITFLNLVAEHLTGWSCREAMGRPMDAVFRILDATSRETVPAPTEKTIGENRAAHLPSNCILVRRDGSEVPIEDSVAPIHDRDGNAIGVVIILRDVSAARSLTLQLAHSAQHDFLTGLPNRMLLNDRVRQATALAPRHRKSVAVLFLDLDGFKHINDSLGHAIGDKALQSVARRLLDCVRDSDTVCRLGGDEFIALLAEIEASGDAAQTAERMLKAVAAPLSIDGHELHITASIGISVHPDDGLDADTLIRNADVALYQAKADGGRNYRYFAPAMNVRAVERKSIEESLRGALERHEFVLHYQPRINLATGTITGAEALIRWLHPTRGLVDAAQFIPVAEDCGLILSIGNWALREACMQARAWRDAGLPVTIAVNISALQFRNEDFLRGLFASLSEAGLDPEAIELELTEKSLMQRVGPAADTLRILRDRGVKVTVDDFGTRLLQPESISKVSDRCPENRPVVHPSDQQRRERYHPGGDRDRNGPKSQAAGDWRGRGKSGRTDLSQGTPL